MKNTNKITMRDIARQMNLSPMTISKALRNSSDISSKTTELVRNTAQEMGYVPNYWAKAAKTGRFNNIAFIYSCPELKDGHPDTSLDHEFLNGIEEVMSAADIHMSISRLGKNVNEISKEDLPRIFRERVTDGIIIECEISQPIKDELKKQGIPVVFLNTNVHEPFNCVYRDEIQAAYKATRHLIELGHKNIATLSFKVEHRKKDHLHFSMNERTSGYIKALEESGLQPVFIEIPVGAYGKTMAGTTIDYLNNNPSTTALVTAGADTIYTEALRCGFRIPNDLSIIALDMSYPSTRVFFHLDKILMDRYGMGKFAAEMLLQKINNPQQEINSMCSQSELELCGSSTRLSNKTKAGE